MGEARVAVALLLGIALASLGASCASESKQPDIDRVRIEQWLPGKYDNHAQVEADKLAGRPARPALTLTVVSVDSLEIGQHVFYLEARDAHDSKHVVAQRLLSFENVNGKLVQTVWTLTDSPRWRDGDEHPELFSSLQPPDVKLMKGCELIWKQDGAKFTASADPLRCRKPPAPAEGSTLAEQRVELSADELAVSDRPETTPAAPASDTDAFVRFKRQD
jgi:hypothetical protein